MDTVTTTAEDFKLFKRLVNEYLAMFGLLDWRVHFAHHELEDSRAQVSYQVYGRIATFTLSKVWDMAPVEMSLRRSAYHEVMELMLGPLRQIACDYSLNDMARNNLLDTETHVIIRRLENVYLGSDPC